MPFLTIAAHDYGIQTKNARGPARTRVGQVVAAFDGTLRSTIRAYKRKWGPFDTMPLTEDEYAQLVTDIDLGMVTVGGGVIGADILADVQITGVTYILDVSQPHEYDVVATVTIDEA